MNRHKPFVVAVALFVAAALGGCAMGNWTGVQNQLRTVSAGYTGCMPNDNVLSNVDAHADGSGTWNASCKGKTYLCSAMGDGHSESYHCAPVAQ